MDRFKGHKGITAMVLIFSVLILIIIAGISISAIVGDNGVLDTALDAKTQAEVETYTEELEVLEVQAKTEQINDGMSTKEYIDEMKEKVLNSTVFEDAEDVSKVTSSTLRVETDEGYVFIVTEDGITYVDGDEEAEYEITADDVTITLDPSSWTNTDVIVTVTMDFDTTASVQYSLDDTTYYDYDDSTGVTVSTNGTIYVQLVSSSGDVLNSDVISADIDIIDKLEPVIDSVTVSDKTITTIEVIADATDSTATDEYGCSGIDHYEYSYDGGETWVESDENTYTFTGLETSTTYEIVVKVVDKAGNEATYEISAETDKISELVLDENIEFVYNTEDWTNEDVTATIELSDEIQVYVDEGIFTLEYSTDGTNWYEYTGEITFEENGILYARIVYEGETTNEVSEDITWIDLVSPTVEITDSTTNSITFTGTDSDSGVVGYYYSTDSSDPTEETDWIDCSSTGTEVTEIITGLIQNTTYYVWAIDDAGNISEYDSIVTGTVPGGEDDSGNVDENGLMIAVITFTYSTTDWTNENVDVTISVNGTIADEVENGTYVIQYSYDANTWTTYTEAIEFTTNGTIYARLYDGTNGGNYATGQVNNIDKINPKSFEIETSDITMTSITISGSTDDADATSSYGKSGIRYYEFSTDGGVTWIYTGADEEETSYTITELTAGTSYSFAMKAVDNAGNSIISTVLSCQTLPKLVLDENIEFIYNTEDWTNEDVTVAIELSDEIQAYVDASTYILEYSTDGTNWYEYTGEITFEENGTLYARIVYEGETTNEVSESITWIDLVDPVIESVSDTSSTITITATDDVSGIVGYYISTSLSAPSDTSLFTSYSSDDNLSVEITIRGLSQETTYYVWVIDGAGNISEYKAESTAKVPGGEDDSGEVDEDNLAVAVITFGYSETDWTNENVDVTISVNGDTAAYVADGTYVIQYSYDATDDTSWTTYTEAITFDVNKTIYARLYDGTNYGDYATGQVTNIDKLAPNEFEAATSDTTSCKTTVTGSTEDAESTDEYGCSGIDHYEFSKDGGESWFYVGEDENETSYIFTELTQDTTYTFMMKAVDKAGNETKTDAVQNTTEKIPDGTDVVTDDDGTETTVISFSYDIDLSDGDKTTSEGWTTTDVTATITVNGDAADDVANGNYTIVYTYDDSVEDDEWIEYTEELILSENQTIHAKLSDGTNYGGENSDVVDWIDEEAPQTPDVTYGDVTESSIVATAESTDEISGIASYYFWIELSTYDDDGNQVLTDLGMGISLTEPTYEFTGLSGGCSYVVNVIAYDIAGNYSDEGEMKIVTGDISEVDLYYNYNMYGWGLGDSVNYSIDLDSDGDTTDDWVIYYLADVEYDEDGNKTGYLTSYTDSDGNVASTVTAEEVGKDNLPDYVFLISTQYLKNTFVSDDLLDDMQVYTYSMFSYDEAYEYEYELFKSTSYYESGYTFSLTTSYPDTAFTWYSTTYGKDATTKLTAIDDLNTNNLKYFMNYWLDENYSTSTTYANLKLSAILSNTNYWDELVDTDYASYAVGASSLEMFVASWIEARI